MPEHAITLLRQNRNLSSDVIRGKLPDVSINPNSWTGFLVGSIFIIVFSVLFCEVGLGGLGSFGTLIAFLFITSLLLSFWFWPIVFIKYKTYKTGEKPSDEILKKFYVGYAWLKKYIYKHELVKITRYTLDEENKSKPIIAMKRNRDLSHFYLWIGKSTGHLAKLWHPAGMAEDQNISLNLEDACQNIMVLGGIGSGKTTCVMQPLLLQCLDQQCGGLIFDIKGDVKETVKQFADSTNKELVILGPDHTRMNLIEGLTPEVASSFLKSAFLLSDKRSIDSFWIDTATELCRNTLGMLSFLPNHYNLQNLHQYLFDLDTQETINQEIDNLLPTLPTREARLLKTYCNYHDLIFSHFDSKIKSGVNATVAQALAPFNHPDLLDAFCLSDSSPAKMEDVLNGTLYLVDMPLSVWGLGGKVAYTFIKLRFFNLMQNRNQTSHFNKTNPVFFMCDEYQEIVSASRDGLSDLNFWDKSRSSKTIGIISSQSIASFYAAISSHDLSHALLQNFRQKLCLRTEDPVTLEFMERLIGRAKVKKITDSYAGSGNDHHMSKTITESREGVVDAQLFRDLKPNHAVAILSLSGHSMDDVLSLMPVYIN